MNQPKYIKFDFYGLSKSGVTKIWRVKAKANDDFLGWIKWFSSWRCYAFYPYCAAGEVTIFEKTCLRDIADFCEEQTKLQKEKQK